MSEKPLVPRNWSLTVLQDKEPGKYAYSKPTSIKLYRPKLVTQEKRKARITLSKIKWTGDEKK